MQKNVLKLWNQKIFLSIQVIVFIFTFFFLLNISIHLVEQEIYVDKTSTSSAPILPQEDNSGPDSVPRTKNDDLEEILSDYSDVDPNYVLEEESYDSSGVESSRQEVVSNLRTT